MDPVIVMFTIDTCKQPTNGESLIDNDFYGSCLEAFVSQSDVFTESKVWNDNMSNIMNGTRTRIINTSKSTQRV